MDGKTLLLFVGYQGTAQGEAVTIPEEVLCKAIQIKGCRTESVFVVGGAKYAEDLKRFHQLQDEYLLLVNNDIKSIVELVDFISEKEDRIQQIEDRQKEIYRESSSRKRSIKNEEQYREYQIWHMEVQEELDELKQEKREIKRQIQLADDIIKRRFV